MERPQVLELHSTRRADRVREHTGAAVLARLDAQLVARLADFVRQRPAPGGEKAITTRLCELEQESDVERTLEVNAAVLALAGTLLGAVHRKGWLLLPAVVTAFLLQHGTQGWCPPLAVLRRLGIRSRQEIETERFALMLLRGDLALPEDGATDPAARAREILAAVSG